VRESDIEDIDPARSQADSSLILCDIGTQNIYAIDRENLVAACHQCGAYVATGVSNLIYRY
jgi:hypothetical protein